MSLRSIAVAAVFLSVSAATLRAQVEYGVKAGLSFGNISNKGLLPGPLKTRSGTAGGIYLGTRATVVGLGVEALYAQRGVVSAQSGTPVPVLTKRDYVDIPAYLKVTIPSPGVRPFIYAGPQFSFEVKCKTASDSDCPSSVSRKKTDYAGIIGVGIRLGGKSLGVALEARYVYGLADLKLSTVSDPASYKNRTFMLLASVGR